MPLPPYPVLAYPRTWSPGDQIWTARLDADLQNAALLLVNRPLFFGAQLAAAQSIPNNVVTAVTTDTEILDNWQAHTLPNAAYPAPLPGWYLAEGAVDMNAGTTGSYGAGIQSTQGGVTSSLFGDYLGANSSAARFAAVSDLVYLSNVTNDTVELLCYQDSGSARTLSTPGAYFSAQWVGMPSGLGGGTAVTSPQPAALWPAGSGTVITTPGGIAAGATMVTVGNADGILAGATIGLDYYEGQAVQTYAETVTVTSVSGPMIGITATAYPHAAGAPVAVPVSAAFMNQQARDVVNFLCYPPSARIHNLTSTQSIPSQTFPAATAISFTGSTADNFNGWSAGNPTQWIVPVSGFYYLYGQACLGGLTAANVSAGIGVSGGTIQWGNSVRVASTITPSVIVRRPMRLIAGQYVQVFVSQDSGSSVTVQAAGNLFSTLVAVWRGF